MQTTSIGREIDPLAEFLKRAKPNDLWAAYDLFAGAYSKLVFTMALIHYFPCPATYIFAFFGNTSAMGGMINLAHESQHAALLRNKKWNDRVGAWLCAYPVGSIYGASRAVHLAHHKYLNTDLDPDKHFHWEADKSTPSGFLMYFVKLVMGGQLWTSIVVNGFLRAQQRNNQAQAAKGDTAGQCDGQSLTQPATQAAAQPAAPSPASVIVMPKRSYPEVFNLIPVQAVLFFTFWAVSGIWWLYFALWMLPIFTLGTAFGFMRGFIDHARLASDDEVKADGRLITVPNPSFIDKIFFTGNDFEFHAEHHFFPSVPHYFLPRLHRILQQDPRYSSRYLLRPSYTSFLSDYWKQICRGEKSSTKVKAVGDNLPTSGPKKLKVLFVQPKLSKSFWGMEYTAPIAGYKYPNPPLGIMTLAGVLTPDYYVEIRDENVGLVEYDTDADIVGISGGLLHHQHVDRVIQLAKYFKTLGKTVCIGGPVANLSPDVVRPYCDVLFEGEGERTWPQFMKDYEAGDFKDAYIEIDQIDLGDAKLPRIDLIRAADYGAGQIQTTRGCPFTCEFCDIIVVFGRKVRSKPVAAVIKEVETWANAGQQMIFFSDDNFIGKRVYAKELLRALIEFNKGRKYPVAFYTQASIDAAKDPELLGLMRDADFAGFFIGIESPRKSVLAETLKVQNVHTENLEDAIHTIQSFGLWVSGGMIVGFDNDDKDIFEEQYQFLQKSGVVFAQMSLLEAMPKTPLYTRIKAAGRLLEYRDGLATNIKPVNLTYNELVSGYTSLIKKVYTHEACAERFLTALSYMKGYTFPFDRQAPSFKNLLIVSRVTAHYLFTLDNGRRNLFFKMIIGTLKIQPYALRWTFRYLGQFIHFHRFANHDVYVTMAPVMPTGEPDLVTVPPSEPVVVDESIPVAVESMIPVTVESSVAVAIESSAPAAAETAAAAKKEPQPTAKAS
jgi:radical SAM superfamily enzyme YgiQ (UPF0313 family)/fatty acid desaturase